MSHPLPPPAWIQIGGSSWAAGAGRRGCTRCPPFLAVGGRRAESQRTRGPSTSGPPREGAAAWGSGEPGRDGVEGPRVGGRPAALTRRWHAALEDAAGQVAAPDRRTDAPRIALGGFGRWHLCIAGMQGVQRCAPLEAPSAPAGTHAAPIRLADTAIPCTLHLPPSPPPRFSGVPDQRVVGSIRTSSSPTPYCMNATIRLVDAVIPAIVYLTAICWRHHSI